MPTSRTILAFTIVPIALAIGVFACGGKVEPDAPSDSGATPGSGGTGTATGGSGGGGSGTGTEAGTGTATATVTATVTPTEIRPDLAGCPGRVDTCAGGAGGYVTDIVDRWMKRILDECEHPTTGIPPAFPACGTVFVKFYRPGGAGCVEDVKFSVPQSPAFAACIATAVANQKCAAGLFLDGDSRTFDLCPPP